jgi:hypothetical protein
MTKPPHGPTVPDSRRPHDYEISEPAAEAFRHQRSPDGGAAIVAGIILSSLPLLPGRRHPRPPASARTTQPIAVRQPSPVH